MTPAPLIPQAFWFRLEFSCPRDDRLPRAGTRGLLLDLPRSCALPETSRLEGREPWAEVRVAWNPAGLAVAVQITGKTEPVRRPDPADPEFADRVQIGIDTRDTRDIHRASRFCHRFLTTLLPGKRAGKSLDVEREQRPIHRALADAPMARPETILTRAHSQRTGWLLEQFFRAESLHGYDPETNRRLGLMVQVTAPGLGDHFLGVGREFPISEDPSLWSTLELLDTAPSAS